MIKETDAAVAKKHTSWNKNQKTMSKEDLETAQEANQESTKKCRQAKAKFEGHIVSQFETNPKSFWGYVGSKMSKKSSISDLIVWNGETV